MTQSKTAVSFLIIPGLILMLASLAMGLSTSRANATPLDNALLIEAIQGPNRDVHASSDCQLCHNSMELVGTLANGEIVPLSFNAQSGPHSIHTQRIGCRACHSNQNGYPHADSQQQACAACHWNVVGNPPPQGGILIEMAIPDARTIFERINPSCKKCHETKLNEVQKGEHALSLASGNRYAPLCVDCHFTDNQSLEQREAILQVCGRCHLATLTAYQSSVHADPHGSPGNPDKPTCADCHGVHEVMGPNNPNFRKNSIAVCGDCHSNVEMMARYELSTNVFSTYLNDFHGRTVDFSRKSNITQINEATCYDCHDSHNIRSSKDEYSSVYLRNIQRTCQNCHPNAGANFTQAWLGHSSLTWDSNPVLFAVNQVYPALIFMLVGSFGVYNLLDARRRLAEKRRLRKLKTREEEL